MTKSEKRKKMALAGLGALLVGVVFYQLFLSDPAPRGRLNRNANSPAVASAPTGTKPAPKTSRTVAEQQAYVQQLLANQAPLDFSMLRGDPGPSEPGPRQNIFAVWVAPPQPPPPPPPPPPIALQGLQPPGAVAETPRKITLNVFANPLPPDAAIFFNGAQRQTKRVKDTQLSTDIEPSEYSSPGSISVQVKSVSQGDKLFSGQLQFTVQRAPDPPVKYIARLGKLSEPETNFGVFEVGKEIKRLKRGDTVSGVWRVDSINSDSAEFTNTQYEIRRKVMLQERPTR
jgi:hypothetical protein